MNYKGNPYYILLVIIAIFSLIEVIGLLLNPGSSSFEVYVEIGIVGLAVLALYILSIPFLFRIWFRKNWWQMIFPVAILILLQLFLFR